MPDTIGMPPDQSTRPSNREAIDARFKKRQAAEKRFRRYGQLAIGLSIFFLVLLISSVTIRAISGFSKNVLLVDIPTEFVLTESPSENQDSLTSLVLKDVEKLVYPEGSKTRPTVDVFNQLAAGQLVREFTGHAASNGGDREFSIPLSDEVDLYLKGGVSSRTKLIIGQAGRLSRDGQDSYVLTDGGPDGFPELSNALTKPISAEPSTLVRLGSTWFSVTEFAGASLRMRYLGGAAPSLGEQSGLSIHATLLWQNEENRTLSDQEIAWAEILFSQGKIKRQVNWSLFTNADSTYPELAGAAAAIVGSLIVILVTALFAIPIGILAAIYLEEFAPKNRVTGLIELNINNLAAVPSIIFGLLGAVVFLNIFGMPRSAPIVGGLVLGLLILPTIIIASRAALGAVPQSTRDAALGVGASPTQTVFHHVLPLAAPGIVTGVIIAIARALGETAPLLIIGMVAFVNEVPSGPNDEATALPVLIFNWFGGAERAWEPKTSAIILILLMIVISMNIIAAIVRRRFEQRW